MLSFSYILYSNHIQGNMIIYNMYIYIYIYIMYIYIYIYIYIHTYTHTHKHISDQIR